MVGWILMKTDSSANLRLGLALRRIKDPTCCAKDMLRFGAAGGWEEHEHLRVILVSNPSLSWCSALGEAKELRSFSWWKYCSPPACKARWSIIKDFSLTALRNQGLLFLQASSHLWTQFAHLLLPQLNELLLSSGLRNNGFHRLYQTAEQFKDERASHFIYPTAARAINHRWTEFIANCYCKQVKFILCCHMYGQTVQEVAKQRTELLLSNPFNLFSFYLKIINNCQSKELILTCAACWVILSISGMCL